MQRQGPAEPEECALALIGQILGQSGSARSIHDILANRLPERGRPNALGPGPEIDAALSRLVRLLTNSFACNRDPTFQSDVVQSAHRRIVTDPELYQRALTVRRAAGLAESRMEIHHARRLLANTDPSTPAGKVPSLRRALHPFPYLRNYEHLVGAELAGLSALGRADRSASRKVVELLAPGPEAANAAWLSGPSKRTESKSEK